MIPALIVVLGVIVFPWLFTIWMSLNEWKVGSPVTFVGLSNYLRLPNDPRFVEAVAHTVIYTALSVLLLVIWIVRPYALVLAVPAAHAALLATTARRPWHLPALAALALARCPESSAPSRRSPKPKGRE